MTPKQSKKAAKICFVSAMCLGALAVLLICLRMLSVKKASPTSMPKEPKSAEPDDSEDDSVIPFDGDNIPEDRPCSPIVAQHKAIIDINALPGRGKTPLAFTLCCEACEGKSYNLLSTLSGIPLPPFKCIWFHTEYDEHFKEHYGAKIQEFGSRIVVFNEAMYPDMPTFIKTLEASIAKANDNCCVIIDTPSSLLKTGAIKLNEARIFINELKRVRRRSGKKGFIVSFILVTHKSPSTGEAQGSSAWFQDSETFIDMSDWSGDPTNMTSVLEVKKRKGGPRETVYLRRVVTPFMHFERVPDPQNNSTTVQNPQSALSVVSGNATKSPLDKDVDLFLHDQYQEGVVSYNNIYKQYKNQYQLKNRDAVVNAIRRVEDDIIEKLSEDDIDEVTAWYELTKMEEGEILREAQAKYNIRTIAGIRKIHNKGLVMVNHPSNPPKEAGTTNV